MLSVNVKFADMIKKLVILAGGRGSRFIEETHLTPKPMITIGGIPIILHIMNYYSFFGVKEFIICGGYKIENIKNFFMNLNNFVNDLAINYAKNEIKFLTKNNFDWNVKIIDTGLHTMTGGRIKRVKKYLTDDENFFLTYGDGLSNVNIEKLSKFHIAQKKIATLTMVLPPAKYGVIEVNKNIVTKFQEKPRENNILINGGFFVLNKKIFKFIKNDKTIFEENVMKKLTKLKELNAYKHFGSWQSMDSLKDKLLLEELWTKNPFWKK